MVAPKIEVDTKAVEAQLAKLATKYGKATVTAAVASGELVRGTAIKSIQNKSMGSQVTRTTTSGQPYNHTSSKAGDAPNTDTGRLISSIQVETDKKGVTVGSSLKYAKWLEFGTKIMRARPWLWPALEQNRAVIRKIFGKGIDKVTMEHNK